MFSKIFKENSCKKFMLCIIILITAVFFSSRSLYAEKANATIQLGATNTSDIKKEKIFLRYDLPRELKKDDIIELSGMELGYDSEKTTYFLSAYVNLEPKETKKFTITVRDIWQIPDSQVDFLKEQVDVHLKNIAHGANYENVELFGKKLLNNLEEIKSNQQMKTGDLEKRVFSYRAGMEQLEDMKVKVMAQDDFIQEAERYADIIKANKHIRFIIESTNTDPKGTTQDTEIVKYLPQGIKPEHLLDHQDFNMHYDVDARLYYVTKKITLKPGELKVFNLVIMDIWRILESRLDQYAVTADKLMAELAGSSYHKLAAFLTLEIKQLAKDIKETQNNASTPNEKMAAYAENLSRMQLIKEKLDQLRQMKAQQEEIKKLKSVTAVVKSVTPDVATTWMLIYTTIAFLAFISTFLYILWWGQTKVKQKRDQNLAETSVIGGNQESASTGKQAETPAKKT